MIRILFRLLIGALAVAALPAAIPADRYAEGQVWEYRTRPQDVGSLLKIQKIEDGGKMGVIYHISVIGIRLRDKRVAGLLEHSPVSRATLDASIVRLSTADRDWPDATAGIAEWRSARGGVYTIPVSQIIDLIDQTLSTPEAPAATPTPT